MLKSGVWQLSVEFERFLQQFELTVRILLRLCAEFCNCVLTEHGMVRGWNFAVTHGYTWRCVLALVLKEHSVC